MLLLPWNDKDGSNSTERPKKYHVVKQLKVQYKKGENLNI